MTSTKRRAPVTWPRGPLGSAHRPAVRKARVPRKAALAAIAAAAIATLAAAHGALAAAF